MQNVIVRRAWYTSCMSASSVRIPTFTISVGLILALVAIFIAAGVPTAPIVLLGVLVALAFTYRFTAPVFYLAVALTPFIGIRVLVPTGSLLLGTRAFSGTLDLGLAEIVFFFLLAIWIVKMLWNWRRRNDPQWSPRFPLLASYGSLFLAHVVSVWSPLAPDPSLVIKYAFRPVLFDYLAFVALPVNLIRSHRRLSATLGVVATVGTIAAVNGLISVFFPSGSGSFFGSAHPLAIFGVSALGENHNELAEILVFSAPATLALSWLVRSSVSKRLLFAAAAFQFLIGLMTFTRTAWIVYAIEVAFLLATIWRTSVQTYIREVAIALLLLLPLGGAMIAYSVSQTATSSNSTRLMLTQIAFELFRSSPWLGAGAGSFVDRVGSTQVFLLEYGEPLDSHGIIQKIGAETGILGLLALAFVIVHIGRIAWSGARRIRNGPYWGAYALLIAGTMGALAYQIFNTDYWTGKMWLPVGILLAATSVFRESVLKGEPRDILDA